MYSICAPIRFHTVKGAEGVWGGTLHIHIAGLHTYGGHYMWYNVNQTLTHNALVNMIIGPRGYGKTYGLKKKAIENYMKRGEQFIYLRRYQAELDLVKDTLFADINLNNEFDNQIEYAKGDTYQCNGEIVGYPMALSRANHYKSASFPAVSLIIFDEFIIDRSQNSHYLKNEVRKLLDFIETVGRMRDNIKVFLLANSLSFVNPYTIYWDLRNPAEKKIAKTKNKLVLVELVGDNEFKERKKKTLFGQLIADSQYANMSIDNEFILDTTTFIEQKTGSCRYLLTLEFKNEKFGVWYERGLTTFYVDEHIDPSCRLIYALEIDEHNPDATLYCKTMGGPLMNVMKAFRQGIVRFSNQKTKALMMEVFKSTL